MSQGAKPLSRAPDALSDRHEDTLCKDSQVTQKNIVLPSKSRKLLWKYQAYLQHKHRLWGTPWHGLHSIQPLFPRDQTWSLKNFSTSLCWLHRSAAAGPEKVNILGSQELPACPFPYRGVKGTSWITSVEWMLQTWKSAPRGELAPSDAAHPHKHQGQSGWLLLYRIGIFPLSHQHLLKPVPISF